ncbi:hypothetical protein NM688_g2666 [Phlebia brevispora]|uniref:Uncharacterized protein n=1 Tax=Phlebia brevispora TaxID=194682 RepID=A0ACC1T7V1_9APHY|nr:hypothetical protein NM688_g2666 [Phlebia brevispora]
MLTKRSLNFARIDGIDHNELPAAIIFTVIYVPVTLLLVLFSIRQPTYVFRALTLFSIVRIAAFTMRAILSGSATAGDNVNLVVAQMVIYNVGFSALLYSAYTLVLDRDNMTNATRRQGDGVFSFFKGIIRNRMLIRLALAAAIVIGIIGGVKQSKVNDPSEENAGDTLRKISLYIFLAVVCLLTIVTLTLTFDERAAGVWSMKQTTFGRKYGILVLFLMSLLCLTREAYLAATAGNTAKQNKAAVWYPLVAVTEFICVVLFMVPGLVPTRKELDVSKELGVGWADNQGAPTIPLTRQHV